MQKDKINFLEKRADVLYARLEKCDICPRNCRVNRLKGEKGYCGSLDNIMIYTALIHYGEEPPISGERGSGTIFFSGCNLKCIYCQNYKFSHHFQGKIITEETLAKVMINLQEKGAHNINLVTPTHFLPQILKSVIIAFKLGLSIPIVYNTSGYEKKEIIEFIDSFIDIYLVDMKYITPEISNKYSLAGNYPSFNQETIKIMSRKKEIWENNILKQGVITRHLILPDNLKETESILFWLQEFVPNVLISIMFQYRPYNKAYIHPEIDRMINKNEYAKIKDLVERMPMNGWLQDFPADETLAGINLSPLNDSDWAKLDKKSDTA